MSVSYSDILLFVVQPIREFFLMIDAELEKPCPIRSFISQPTQRQEFSVPTRKRKGHIDQFS
jgi:hypothetical protein